jgi:acetylglutamate kinase
MSTINIIKIGGNIIDHEARLKSFLKDFAALEGPKILVHGGGKIATEIGDRMAIVSQYVEGRRITDAATIELVTMVYGGLINKRIVAGLQAEGCNAMGLTGADGNCVTGQRRPVAEVDYGFVGDLVAGSVNKDFLYSLLESGLTPVLAALSHDGQGAMLNTNADTIAQEVAKALSAQSKTRLVYCFEKGGLLRDIANEFSVIASVDKQQFAQLKKEGIISDGMIPKLDNAFSAIKAGVGSVAIGKAEDLHAIIHGGKGTHIL